jgi:GAF domain-containing protein
LVDSTRQWFKARLGLDAQETCIDVSFCRHTLGTATTLVVEDAKEDTRFAQNDLVTGDPYIRFYAGAPIIDPDGYVLGTVCIIDTEPREISRKEIWVLEGLADCTMTAIRCQAQEKLLQRAEKIIEGYLDENKATG